MDSQLEIIKTVFFGSLCAAIMLSQVLGCAAFISEIDRMDYNKILYIPIIIIFIISMYLISESNFFIKWSVWFGFKNC